MRLHNLGIARKLWLGVIFLIVANMFIVGFSGVRTATLTARFDAAFAQLDAKLAAKATAIDVKLVKELSAQPKGTELVRVGDRVVRLDSKTRVVLDVSTI